MHVSKHFLAEHFLQDHFDIRICIEVSLSPRLLLSDFFSFLLQNKAWWIGDAKICFIFIFLMGAAGSLVFFFCFLILSPCRIIGVFLICFNYVCADNSLGCEMKVMQNDGHFTLLCFVWLY